MNEARVNIDELKPAEDQVQKVLKDILAIIPIRLETRKIEVRIPAKYSGGSYRILKKYGKIFKESWQDNGLLQIIVELPAGLQNEFFGELNNLTHGEVETKVLSE